jgi:phosphoribosylformylglycinamidine synthase PurS subunit
MRVRINIVLKSSVLDPQGQAVATSLLGQGFDNIKNVRQGKILDIEFNSNEVDISMINEMCEGFLTNPLVEDYAIEEINT